MKIAPYLLLFSFFITQNVFCQTSYNFYWGHYQAKLEAANHFRSSIKVKYLEFSNIISSPPYIWDGEKMLDFHFKINGIVFQNRDLMEYKESIASLEKLNADFLSTAFQIDSISLNKETFGAINIEITDYFDENKAEISMWGSSIVKGQVSNFDDYNIQIQRGALSYRWGKYIVHGERPHTYIGISQFWETMKEMPEILRSSEFPTEAIKAQIEVQKSPRNTTVFSFLLHSADNYQDFYQNLSYQKRFFKPNTLLYVVFDVDITEKNLATHRLILLADDDPRLSLEKTDYQNFKLKWGNNFSATKEKVFLKILQTKKGDFVHADPKEEILHPFNFNTQINKGKDNRLELNINGKKTEHWACEFATEGINEESFFYDNQKGLSAAEWAKLDSFQVWNGLIIIKKFKVENHDLEPFSFRLFSDFSLSYRNKMSKFATINPPQINENDASIQISYEINVGTIGNIKIVDSEGIELWVKSKEFEKGKFSELVKEIKLDKSKIYRVQIATGAGIIEKEFSH